jgi:hypothetical protein
MLVLKTPRIIAPPLVNVMGGFYTPISEYTQTARFG